jgi:hypothetical protein
MDKKMISLEKIIFNWKEGKPTRQQYGCSKLKEKLRQYKEVYNCHIR